MLFLEQAGVLESHGRAGREGLQQADVLLVELADAELRQHDHADHPLAVEHGDAEQRFVEVGRSGDQDSVGVVVCVRGVPGLPGLGDMPGQPVPDLGDQGLERLPLVGGQLAAKGDREKGFAVAVQNEYSAVVVVDQLAQLGGDGAADLPHVVQPIELRREPLQNSKLGHGARLSPSGQGRHSAQGSGKRSAR